MYNFTLSKFSFVIGFFSISLLVGVTSCQREICEPVVMEVIELRLQPQEKHPTSGWGMWNNDNKLPIDRLILEINMLKNSSSLENVPEECPRIFINSDPAQDFKLISNKDFNTSYPAGSDLLEIVDFSYALQDFTKEEFIHNHFNQSNWDRFHLTFNTSPDSEDLHTFILIAKLEDGTTKESIPAVDVLIIPSE